MLCPSGYSSDPSTTLITNAHIGARRGTWAAGADGCGDEIACGAAGDEFLLAIYNIIVAFPPRRRPYISHVRPERDHVISLSFSSHTRARVHSHRTHEDSHTTTIN